MRGFARGSLKLVNSILKRIVLLLLLLLLAVSIYSLWDNRQVYQSVDKIMSELYQWRPTELLGSDGSASGELDFSALKAVNPDVCGWLTIEGTGIDYPIVRGNDNQVYLNRDVFGEFSLAGSIYMDARNDANFYDNGTIIYGHHMDRHLMFGDLDLFLNEEFFDRTPLITLYTEQGERTLMPLAVMEVPASEATIFDLPEWDGDVETLLDFIREQGIHIDDYTMEILSEDPTTIQIIVLVTCSSGHTNSRTILITITPKIEPTPDEPEPTPGVTPAPQETPSGGIGDNLDDEWNTPAKTGDPFYNSPVFWAVLLVCAVLVFAAAAIFDKKKAYTPKHGKHK